MNFDQWYQKLLKLWPEAESVYEKDSWREYFDEDYSPQEALNEECNYGLDS